MLMIFEIGNASGEIKIFSSPFLSFILWETKTKLSLSSFMLNQIDDIPACQKQSAKKIVSLVVIISRAFQHLQLSTWYWLLNKNFLLFRELRVGVLEIERDFVQIPIYSSEAFHWAAHNPQMVKPDLWNNIFCLDFGKRLNIRIG